MDKDDTRCDAPELGSAQGLVAMQPGWEAPMTPSEIEDVFFPQGKTSDAG